MEHALFTEMPLRAITPKGWLREFLQTQADGLTGHIEKAGYPFNVAFWGDDSGRYDKQGHWSRFEQTAYWLDGAVRCGHLLRDSALVSKAYAQIDAALKHADEEGFIGPKNAGRWSHAVFFRAVMAHESATGDEAILDAVHSHLLADADEYDRKRDVCMLETLLWVADRTDDLYLRSKALRSYASFNGGGSHPGLTVMGMASDAPITEHGVTFHEIAKLGALVFLYGGDKEALEATCNAYRKLAEQSMLASGLHSCTEHVRGRDPLDSHETCDISDYTWALGYLLMATGDAAYADQIERVCFNAGPGAVRSDFTALQYFSCPNQVLCTSTSNHNLFFRGEPWMAYRPSPSTECCPGNVNRFMPNYAARMWMTGAAGGAAAVLYGPSSLEIAPGYVIHEETNYPFDDTVVFRFELADRKRIPLTVRIPSWCDSSEILINDTQSFVAGSPGSFLTFDREWSDGDLVVLRLPLSLKAVQWPRGGISIERGPLTFSLRIDEEWRELPADARKRVDPRFAPDVDPALINPPDQYPSWDLFPASPWNYALDIDTDNPAKDIRIEVPPRSPANPWSPESPPLQLKVPVRRVNGWDIEHYDEVEEESPKEEQGWKYTITRKKGSFDLTPQLPDPQKLPGMLAAEREWVQFVPYGCTHLRMTVLPNVR
ncbi:MAG: hypothetical protein GF331_03880 [Chitinivibrionales bacterium]|nr:hypothetical protein [Chitinivibrionales bacterium]